ncbi:hypothetical protein LIER_15054 [Lithospermum erythrorhizon]|uniref:Uncharacterized protein n=1 Tax=Lithospermum erythrorhizon TaxID=34254 RepID=A0AAV3Q5Z6_LITER
MDLLTSTGGSTSFPGAGAKEFPGALDGRTPIWNLRGNRARPEFPELSFSMKDFERVECAHEDPLIITPVIANVEVEWMLVDTESLIDILFFDVYLKLGMSQAQIRPVATPSVGFTGNAVSPLGVSSLMITIGKHV